MNHNDLVTFDLFCINTIKSNISNGQHIFLWRYLLNYLVDIHGPQRMNYNVPGDSLTFPQAPPSRPKSPLIHKKDLNLICQLPWNSLITFILPKGNVGLPTGQSGQLPHVCYIYRNMDRRTIPSDMIRALGWVLLFNQVLRPWVKI